jgi:hypothetical protein
MITFNEFGLTYICILMICMLSGRFAFIVAVFLGGTIFTSSVFDVNLGGSSFPMMPGNFAAILFLLTFLPQTRRYYLEMRQSRNKAWNALFLFCLIAAVSSVVLSRVFAGSVMVSNAHDIINDIFWAVPLQYSATNISQTGYIIEVTLTALSIAAYFHENPGDCPRFIRMMYKFNWAVLGLALWELLSAYLLVPFPFSFIQSTNLQRYAINVGGFMTTRVSGTFGEPSQFAPYLAGMILLCLMSPSGMLGRTEKKVLIGGNFLAILASTSTTAFAAGVLVLLFYLAFCKKSSLQGRIKIVVLGVAGLAGCALLVTIFLASQIDVFLSFYQSMVFDKLTDLGDRTSAGERLFRDMTALGAFASTYGLGAGWGSTRASSLIPHILGNVGLPGLAAFGTFVYMFWKGGKDNKYAMPLAGFYAGALIAACLAVTDFLVYQLYWIVAAASLGLVTSASKAPSGDGLTTTERETDRRGGPRVPLEDSSALLLGIHSK